MKPLALIAVITGIAYVIARKTGLLSRDQIDTLTDQASAATHHVADAAKSAGETAFAAVSETAENLAAKASDVLPNSK